MLTITEPIINCPSVNTYHSCTEEELISLCQEKSDTEAFDELATRCMQKIKCYLIGKFNDPVTAEEVLQIALIKAWKNIGKYKGNSKFLSWVNRIAHNAYYDYKRKYKKEVSIEGMKESRFYSKDGNSSNIDLKLGLVVVDPHRKTDLKDLSLKLNKAISMLSKSHQQVLKMREVEDLSCSEISVKIDCPYPTVCTRLFYARKKAKEILLNLKDD